MFSSQLTVFLLCLSLSSLQSLAAPSNIQALIYLRQYVNMDSTASNLVNNETVSNAINEFQRFAGLPVTGVLDKATLNVMEQPRCGLEDQGGLSASNRKVELQGTRWRMLNLGYRVSNYPRSLQNKTLVDSEIARAFQTWSEVTNIKFFNHENLSDDLIHIDIRFETGDGVGNVEGVTVLGFAHFPYCGYGDITFDDEQEWTVNDYNGVNLFRVAVHEIGHAIGLDHSEDADSAMGGHKDYVPGQRLSSDDILAVQALYGRPNRSPPSVVRNHFRRNPDPDGPNICNDPSLDAATIVDDGRAFFFKGNHYWEVEESGIVYGPRKISEDWDGLPGNIDAAMTWANGKTHFYKGTVYYQFTNQQMDSGYPESIQSDPENLNASIPENLNAAFMWGGNGRTYYFKDDLYWKYEECKDPKISLQYPLYIEDQWSGVPSSIDAVLTWVNQKTYFFKGNEFYRYDDKTNKVDQHLSISKDFLYCKD